MFTEKVTFFLYLTYALLLGDVALVTFPKKICILLSIIVLFFLGGNIFVVVLNKLLIESLPFGCTGAKSLGYALSHAVRIITKERFHKQFPTLFGRDICGIDLSDLSTSLLKHSNDVCLTLVESRFVFYLCICWIGIAEKIEGVVCALLHYTSVIVLLDSFSASLLLLRFEIEISLRVLCSFGKDFSKDRIERAIKTIAQFIQLFTECVDIVRRNTFKQTFREIHSSFIGLLNKVVLHREFELLPCIRLSGNSKAHLLKSLIHASLYRLHEQVLLSLIHTQADSLLHLGVYLAFVEVTHVIHDSVRFVLLLLQFLTPSTFAVTLVPFFLSDSVLVGSIVLKRTGSFIGVRGISFRNKVCILLVNFLFLFRPSTRSVCIPTRSGQQISKFERHQLIT